MVRLHWYTGSTSDVIRGTKQQWEKWFDKVNGDDAFYKADDERFARLAMFKLGFADELMEMSEVDRLVEINFHAATKLHPTSKGLGGIYKLTQ